MLGDLKHGRTVHSLAKLLALFNSITINYVSPGANTFAIKSVLLATSRSEHDGAGKWFPETLRIPDEVREAVARSSTIQNEYTTLDEVVGSTDVLYVTRVQKERFEDAKQYEAIKDAFIVDRAVMSRVREPYMGFCGPIDTAD